MNKVNKKYNSLEIHTLCYEEKRKIYVEKEKHENMSSKR